MGLSRSQNVEQRLPEERRSGKKTPTDQMENILWPCSVSQTHNCTLTKTHTHPVSETQMLFCRLVTIFQRWVDVCTGFNKSHSVFKWLRRRYVCAATVSLVQLYLKVHTHALSQMSTMSTHDRSVSEEVRKRQER